MRKAKDPVQDLIKSFTNLARKLHEVFLEPQISMLKLPYNIEIEGIKVNCKKDLSHYRNSTLINVSPSQLGNIHPSNIIVLNTKFDIILNRTWVHCSEEIRDHIIGLYHEDKFYPITFGYTIMNNPSLFVKGLKYNIFRGLLSSPDNNWKCIAKAPVVMVYGGVITTDTYQYARRIRVMPEIHSSQGYKSIPYYNINYIFNPNLIQLEVPINIDNCSLDKFREYYPNLQTLGCRDQQGFLEDITLVDVTYPSWDFKCREAERNYAVIKPSQNRKVKHDWFTYKQNPLLIANAQKSQINKQNIQLRRQCHKTQFCNSYRSDNNVRRIHSNHR